MDDDERTPGHTVEVGGIRVRVALPQEYLAQAIDLEAVSIVQQTAATPLTIPPPPPVHE